MKKGKQLNVVLIVLMVFIGSCQLFEPAKIEEPIVFDPSLGMVTESYVKLVKEILPTEQMFTIDPGTLTVLKGLNNTRLYIAANSILDSSGQPVTDSVKVSLTEYFTIADQVLANLQTMHGDSILQTQGMIYFEATDTTGQLLSIDKAKPIRIEIPTKERVEQAKIFIGSRDSSGRMDWGQVVEPVKGLVPLPIKSVSSTNFNRQWSTCPEDYGITTTEEVWEWRYAHWYYLYEDVEKYENTLLATREFRERYFALCDASLLRTYTKNLDKNLWEIDEMMVDVLVKDSIKRVNEFIEGRTTYINVNVRELSDEEVESEATDIDRIKSRMSYEIQKFKDFAAQKLTKVDTTMLVSDTTIAQVNDLLVTYNAFEFGWVNVDYFYRDSTAKDLKFSVVADAPVINLNLYFPELNINMSGIKQADGSYTFTKDPEGYCRLPPYEIAVVVATGVKDDQLVYAKRLINLGESESLVLIMEPATATQIKSSLSDIYSM